jgi:hypothetical protein
MGDYSVFCGLSGIPISPGNRRDNPVVGWKVQRTKFTDDPNVFIPLSLPVHGYYNGTGGIEDGMGKELIEGEMVVICYKSLWDILPSFWNKEDGTTPVNVDMRAAHEKYQQEMVILKAIMESDEDDIYWQERYQDILTTAHSALEWATNNHGILRWISKICLGEPDFKNVFYQYRYCAGPFERLILAMVVVGPTAADFDQICLNIERLIMAYNSVYYRGRPILPNYWAGGPEQYPDFKRQQKWFGSVLKQVKALSLACRMKGYS